MLGVVQPTCLPSGQSVPLVSCAKCLVELVDECESRGAGDVPVLHEDLSAQFGQLGPPLRQQAAAVRLHGGHLYTHSLPLL